MDQLVTLRTPPGTQSVSSGGINFPISDDGFVQVPQDVAAHLMRDHGFRAQQNEPETPAREESEDVG